MSVPTHPCTAYCVGDRHVDLVHAALAWSPGEIAGCLVGDYARLGVTVRVEHVEPAREARPSPDRDGTPRPPWLVTWRLLA